MQIINKKCPYCSAIFKVKSALESHLQTKHADKQMVNIDTIPEINFTPSQQDQLQNIDMSMLNIPPPAASSPDFWHSKLMQPQQPQTSSTFQQPKRGDFSESEISFTDSNNEELGDDDYDFDHFNDDSNHNANGGGGVGGGDKEKSKRHRTHVNRMQKSILRKIFDDVKSPSMVDCENIGREIGLFKRVVQVGDLWFLTLVFKINSFLVLIFEINLNFVFEINLTFLIFLNLILIFKINLILTLIFEITKNLNFNFFS
jgi:AT-binding transcription factor 1